jgi:manganese/zinc/iron transport system substrate-binding protein
MTSRIYYLEASVKNFIKIVLFITILIHALPLVAEPKSTPYQIVTTTGMITDIVSNVVGDKANVRGLIGSGVDPHLYKPTRSDIALLNSADVVFYNGLLLEGKMTDAFIRIATSGKPVFAVTDLLERDFLLEPEEFQGHYDPHVWMDPLAWSEAVEVVKRKLSEFDPSNANFYSNNALEYQKKLKSLHEKSKEMLSKINKDIRVLVTAHDAFNYFGRRYDVKVVGIQGISTESEAGVKDIEEIVKLLVEKKIPAVFIESTVSDRNIKALLEGASAKGHKVIIGGELYSDAMGKPGTIEGTYLGMIEHNVKTISAALGGETR